MFYQINVIFASLFIFHRARLPYKKLACFATIFLLLKETNLVHVVPKRHDCSMCNNRHALKLSLEGIPEVVRDGIYLTLC